MSQQLSLPEGRAARDEALDRLERRRKDYVINARGVANWLIGQEGQVTVDRLRELYPPPADFDARVLGAVLAGKQFKKIGNTHTTRKTSHHRPIGIFGLAS